MRRPRRFFLAMHGIKGNDAVRDIEFAEQLLRGGDFVGLFLDIDVCQDETGFDVEGVQHLGQPTHSVSHLIQRNSGNAGEGVTHEAISLGRSAFCRRRSMLLVRKMPRTP